MMHDPMHLAREPEQLRLVARCGATTRSGTPLPVAAVREKALPGAGGL
jgi:hypothetical protein